MTYNGEAHCPHGSQALNYDIFFFLKGVTSSKVKDQRLLCLHQWSPMLMRAEATTIEQRTLVPMMSLEAPCSAEDGALSHGGPAHETTKGVSHPELRSHDKVSLYWSIPRSSGSNQLLLFAIEACSGADLARGEMSEDHSLSV